MIGPLTIAQVLMIGVLAVWALMGMLLHGHPKGGEHSFPVTAAKIILAIVLLSLGGFWVLR